MTFLEIIGTVSSVFGVIGVGIAAAFALFKVLGEKWLTAKFEERLAAYKHMQQRELEELKGKINALMDRTTKLHQREFEVLPEVWGRLVSAHRTVTAVISPFQSTHDLDRMQEPQFEDFVTRCTLAQWQKDELRNSTSRTDYYFKAHGWQKINAARDVQTESLTTTLHRMVFSYYNP